MMLLQEWGQLGCIYGGAVAYAVILASSLNTLWWWLRRGRRAPILLLAAVFVPTCYFLPRLLTFIVLMIYVWLIGIFVALHLLLLFGMQISLVVQAFVLLSGPRPSRAEYRRLDQIRVAAE